MARQVLPTPHTGCFPGESTAPSVRVARAKLLSLLM